MKEAMHHVLYSYLRCQYLHKVYEENPDSDIVVVQTASIESYKWWKTLLIDLDIVLGGAAVLFVIMAFLPKAKAKEN